ncbi:kinase-like domain-containing protein [Rhizophagus irregularis DAOM 181602=DAOM 197198]|uniref:Serine-threonine/tyrosine-protein kinase catalytic domain-containing protein n=1 Tax=Rhizophagus irregularis (strain DAOM 197198w) TaxID=1432141 RepID=A0A015KTU0_RHIIW|nr:hypothetical protein RirG_153350 [Rhizophagus irregularis DAOM 197198w]GBC30965.2 kinase-like domain-containing protein [Rhizophagus irregularis DAOM 181602=DAOM 197198]
MTQWKLYLNKLNISNGDSAKHFHIVNLLLRNHGVTIVTHLELMMEGWTSGNSDVDKFIDIKEIDEGGFSKVYSAIWTDGKSKLLKIHWNTFKEYGLTLYGITNNPDTKKFMMMIIQFTDKGSFENILQADEVISYISDFGLSGLANEQISDDKVYVVTPFIYCTRSLNRESYTSPSDIYSLAICSGLRPEFGKGTSECYKKLAYKRMNSNSIERPPAKGLK